MSRKSEHEQTNIKFGFIWEFRGTEHRDETHRKVNKRIIEFKNREIEDYTAQILVLKKIIVDMEIREAEKERELTERTEEIKVKLERTENMFQTKEKKWSELERIVVVYARKDHELRKKLGEIKYICDDPSSKRRITTVVEENEDLKSQLDIMEKKLNDYKSQVTYAKSNPTCMYDDEDDEFKINMHYEEDEVRMDKKQLTKKSPLNMSALTDNKSCTDLNKAFADKSRIDTSNMICDEENILDGMQLDKSNISTYECSRCKKLMFENRMQQQIIEDLK